MVFKQVLMIIITAFFALGLLDRVLGGKMGLAPDFCAAFDMAGRIMLSVIGMICLAPVLARWASPLVGPALSSVGIDPAMFAPLFLAPDSGGWAVAQEMGGDPEIARWAGSVVAAHIGSCISFNIPAALGVIDERQHRPFALGSLCGFAACPLGCFLGGLICGLPAGVILLNLIPAIALSVLIVVGLSLFRETAIKVFVIFGKLLGVVIAVGLFLAATERLTGFALIPGMRDFGDGALIAATVVLTMGGIMVMTGIIVKLFRRPLASAAGKLGVSELTLLGCLNALSSIMPGFLYMKNMNYRGKVVFAAFSCSAANIFGAHLGFLGTTAPEYLMPMVVGKLLTGVVALTLAALFTRGPEQADNVVNSGKNAVE